ncbi:MAG: DUF493 family protein [Motiliproteus sp.]|nr:DUF493 family protein [Motiliproteus sp.]MCW9051530.1 DUF493 family protein [Motiliproteus sp.]
MTEQQPPKIEFPCPGYSIKVIGRDEPGLRDMVVEVMQKHDSGFDTSTITEQPSRNGSFLSVRVKITATGPVQLKAIHEDLMASGRVQMVI